MQLVEPGLGLIFWTSLAFLIVWFLLAKFAWKPILAAIAAREASISEALNASSKAKEEVATLKNEIETLRQEARAEREKIIAEARLSANKMLEEAQEKAKNEAGKIIAQAQEAIQNEKKSALAEVKNQVAILSLAVAEKVIKTRLSDNDSQKALVNEFIKELNVN